MAISGRWIKSGRPPTGVQTSAAAVVVVVLVLLYCIYYTSLSHTHHTHSYTSLLHVHTREIYNGIIRTITPPHWLRTRERTTRTLCAVVGVCESLVHKLRNAQVYLWAAKLPYARAQNKSSWSRRCRLSTTDAHTHASDIIMRVYRFTEVPLLYWCTYRIIW